MMLKPILLVCLFLLTACSTSGTTNPFTPLSIDDNQAAIYVYRPQVMANALYSPDLYINEELKLSVKNGKSTRLTLPAGEYKIKLDAENNSSSLTSLSLTLNPGMTYYIRITTTLKISNASSYEPYQRSFNIENIEKKQALAEITACCAENGKEVKSEAKQTDKETSDGFSVDKTQNPFSH